MLNCYVHHRQSQFSLFSCRKVEAEETASNFTDESDELPLAKSYDSQGQAELGMSAEATANMSPDHQSGSAISVDIDSSGLQVQPTAQQQRAQQQRLRQVERNLRSSLNLSTILGRTVVESAAFFEAQQVSLLCYYPASQSWQPVAQYCRNQSLAWRQRLSLTWSEYPDLIRQVMQAEAVMLSSNQPAPPTVETRQWLACWPGSWLLVPLKSSRTGSHTAGYWLNAQPNFQLARVPESPLNNQTVADDHWGILALALPKSDCWRVDEIACAQSIALELSLAMHQAQQYESVLVANQELQKLALSDGLTQLANRRRFDEHLKDEWQRLARDQRPLSLILCDLDHFKRYNDTFGHPAGDRCLIRIARALLSGPQRPADLVARYGGEEFAIILPNTDTNGAWRIAQKIHSSIRAQKIAHAPDNEKPYVTVTMGVSTIVPGHETTAQVLVQAADLALYHAKQQGRDRTYVHAYYNTITEAAGGPPGESQPVAMTPPEEE